MRPEKTKGDVATRFAVRFLGRTRGEARGGAHGFTLIEIVIALAIFALVSVMAFRATDAMTRSEARLTEEAAHWRALEQVFSRIETDIGQAVPRPMKHGAQTLPAWEGQKLGEGVGIVQFARAPSRLPMAVSAQSPPPTGLRIAYEWTREGGQGDGQGDGQGASGNANGVLSLLYWSSFDTEENTEPARYTLLTGLALFEIAYQNKDGEWVDTWQPAPDAAALLPRAVRVTIAGGDGAVVWRVFPL